MSFRAGRRKRPPRAHVAGNAQPEQTALLTAEATVAGITVSDLATKVIANADLYETVVGQAAGLRQTLDAALASATDPMEYETILDGGKTQALALVAALGITLPQ